MGPSRKGTAVAAAPSPVAVGLFGFVFLSICFLFAIGVQLVAEISSGLVQAAVLPLRQQIKPVSCEPLSENDGKIVHIDCPIRRLHTFYPPSEFRPNLDPFQGIFFEMKVEMYQHTLLRAAKKDGGWSDSLVTQTPVGNQLADRGLSNLFQMNNNPDYFPHVPGTGRHFGESLYGGGFRLERPHVIDFHSKKMLQLKDDKTYSPSVERPPVRISSQNTQVYNNYLYTGDPLAPQIGDLRISFYGSRATHMSAVGLQAVPVNQWPTATDRDLLGFLDPFGRNNRTRTLVLEGDWTAGTLLDAFTRENDVPAHFTWGSRTACYCVGLLWCYFLFQLKDANAQPPVPRLQTFGTSKIMSAGVVLGFHGLAKLTYNFWGSVILCLVAVLLMVFSLTVRIPCNANTMRRRGDYQLIGDTLDSRIGLQQTPYRKAATVQLTSPGTNATDVGPSPFAGASPQSGQNPPISTANGNAVSYVAL